MNKGFDTSDNSLRVKRNENMKGYIVNDLIGRGVNADVYLAKNVKTGANYALKIYKNNEEILSRGKTEIKLLKHLNQHDPQEE